MSNTIIYDKITYGVKMRQTPSYIESNTLICDFCIGLESPRREAPTARSSAPAPAAQNWDGHVGENWAGSGLRLSRAKKKRDEQHAPLPPPWNTILMELS